MKTNGHDLAKAKSPIKHLRDLTPDRSNARKHSPRNVGLIETALGEVGAGRSIVIDEHGAVLAGNATVEAAARAGIERVKVVKADGNSIIAVQRDGLTARQKKRLALLDNAPNAPEANPEYWDDAVIAELARNERELLDGIFRDNELAKLLAGQGGESVDAEPQIDRAAELLEKWKVKAGDLWRIGEHRLLCGDSTDAEQVERVMGGEKAGACVTDPPYGVDYVTGASFNRYGGSTKHHGVKIIGDDKPFDPAPLLGYPVVVLFGANNFANKLPSSRGWVFWHKRPDMDKNDFGDGEIIWTNQDKSIRYYRHMWNGVLRDSEVGKEHYHPTQKPVALIQWILQEYTKSDHFIYDPYCGSGTTLVACQNIARRCRAIEISPAYCAVILQRMQDAFGITGERVKPNGKARK